MAPLSGRWLYFYFALFFPLPKAVITTKLSAECPVTTPCGKMDHTLVEGDISSPCYNLSRYPPNLNCSYVIDVRGALSVSLTFVNTRLEPYNGSCPYDYVEINSNNKSNSGIKYCGVESENKTFTISSLPIVIRLKTDESSYSSGFRLEYKAEMPTTTSTTTTTTTTTTTSTTTTTPTTTKPTTPPTTNSSTTTPLTTMVPITMPVLEVSTMNPLCGENYFVNTSGTILSPGYRQGQYPVDLRCVYVINITGSPMLFHIWFDEFHHSGNPAQNCIGSDQVRIHTPENNHTFGPYCSTENTNPAVIEVERHVAIVELETDSVLNNGSFRLKYSVNAPPTTSNSPDYTAELPDDKGDPPPIQQVSEDDRWPTWMIILIAVAGTCLVAMVLIILAVIRKKQLAAAALSGMVSRNSEGSGKDEWWLNRLYNNVIPDDEGIHSEYEEVEPIYDNQVFNRA